MTDFAAGIATGRQLGREDREGETQYLRNEIGRLQDLNIDMLAALQESEKYLHSATPDGTPLMYATLQQVRAAIAKAKGRS